jgi:uncharacterized protein
MSELYNLPISGLKEGRHLYDFKISKEFFDKFEESEVKEGDLTADVQVDKSSTHLDIIIKITGTLNIACDRCLGLFKHPVDCSNRLLVKFGKTHDESDPEIITIPADEHQLDMSQYFYEYILLALPIQRVHPDDKNGKSTCDPEMIKKLREHIVGEDTGNDPRWDDLKKLLNNN